MKTNSFFLTKFSLLFISLSIIKLIDFLSNLNIINYFHLSNTIYIYYIYFSFSLFLYKVSKALKKKGKKLPFHFSIYSVKYFIYNKRNDIYIYIYFYLIIISLIFLTSLFFLKKYNN